MKQELDIIYLTGQKSPHITLSLDLELEVTLGEIKQQIEDRWGVAVARQRFVYNGLTIFDDKRAWSTLNDLQSGRGKLILLVRDNLSEQLVAVKLKSDQEDKDALLTNGITTTPITVLRMLRAAEMKSTQNAVGKLIEQASSSHVPGVLIEMVIGYLSQDDFFPIYADHFTQALVAMPTHLESKTQSRERFLHFLEGFLKRPLPDQIPPPVVDRTEVVSTLAEMAMFAKLERLAENVRTLANKPEYKDEAAPTARYCTMLDELVDPEKYSVTQKDEQRIKDAIWDLLKNDNAAASPLEKKFWEELRVIIDAHELDVTLTNSRMLVRDKI